MTDQERDALLQGLAADMANVKASVANLETRLDGLDRKVDDLKETVDSVSDGLQDLRRDLEHHGMPTPKSGLDTAFTVVRSIAPNTF
jgi:archaellum component FlaC